MQAIIYRRYSTDEQSDGSAQTLEAQADRCQDFARAMGWIVTETLTDRAKSAFKREHLRPDAALGKFLIRLRAGEFASGTILIADNLSRLSRRPVSEAMAWVHEVNGFGIEIALADTREVFKPNPSLGDFLQASIKFAVAHQSSADKSDQTRRSKNKLWALAEIRSGAWTNLAGLLPSWLNRTPAGDGFVVDENKAATIRIIYEWSADGIGVNTIVNMLNVRPDLPPFGKPQDYKAGVPSFAHSLVEHKVDVLTTADSYTPSEGVSRDVKGLGMLRKSGLPFFFQPRDASSPLVHHQDSTFATMIGPKVSTPETMEASRLKRTSFGFSDASRPWNDKSPLRHDIVGPWHRVSASSVSTTPKRTVIMLNKMSAESISA